MTKRDALKLRPGDEISYGDSMWGAEAWVPYHHVLGYAPSAPVAPSVLD